VGTRHPSGNTLQHFKPALIIELATIKLIERLKPSRANAQEPKPVIGRISQVNTGSVSIVNNKT
jgi:hypothetical protein